MNDYNLEEFKNGLRHHPHHRDNLPSGEKFLTTFKYGRVDNSQLFKIIGEWREDEDGEYFKYGEKLINFSDSPDIKYWADDARDFAIFTNPLRVKVYDLETENEEIITLLTTQQQLTAQMEKQLDLVKKKLSEGTEILSDRSLEK